MQRKNVKSSEFVRESSDFCREACGSTASVGRVRTFQCTMQLTTVKFPHQPTSGT